MRRRMVFRASESQRFLGEGLRLHRRKLAGQLSELAKLSKGSRTLSPRLATLALELRHLLAERSTKRVVAVAERGLLTSQLGQLAGQRLLTHGHLCRQQLLLLHRHPDRLALLAHSPRVHHGLAVRGTGALQCAPMRRDPHSFHDDQQPTVHHVAWEVEVDFDAHVLRGTAGLVFREPAAAGPLDLDTRGLKIHSITDGKTALDFTLDAAIPVLGSRLRIQLPVDTKQVVIGYETSPDASALQWLTPSQTSGSHPFLFSQCQAIHARSLLPIQDTPRLRVTYDAVVHAPAPLVALMAAEHVGPGRFRMPQPIPPYLWAIAVGELASVELGPRSSVWAEPSVVEKAAAEFAGVENMIVAAEALFGPYPWQRFDLLVMPRSFPYGGMENPRLTFLTPSLIVGDRSQVGVVAHELAHSWTGNLVTNATAEHFWLNEGWTVYAERRILEALSGTEVAELQAALGKRTLERAFSDGTFDKRPELTHLRTHLEGIDPDDAFSLVPYEKGYLLLRALEEHVGRATFDRFVSTYIETFRFSSIETEDFLALCEKHLPGALAAVAAPAWIDGPFLPPNAPQPRSQKLDAITGNIAVEVSTTRAWSPVEWQLYLDALPRLSLADAESLDGRFHLSDGQDCEILVSWLVPAIEAGWQPAIVRAEALVASIGRMKFLRPLYQALYKRDPARTRAAFLRNRPSYHPIAAETVARTVGET